MAKYSYFTDETACMHERIIECLGLPSGTLLIINIDRMAKWKSEGQRKTNSEY